MADDILMTRLEQAVDRRSFLRGSGLFAAALGAGLLAPLGAFAQERKKKEDKKEDKKDKNERKKEEQKKKSEEGKKRQDENLFAEEGQPETLLDADGREYRSCPQCGSNMYRQGRTWTCENCGYSYVE